MQFAEMKIGHVYTHGPEFSFLLDGIKVTLTYPRNRHREAFHAAKRASLLLSPEVEKHRRRKTRG